MIKVFIRAEIDIWCNYLNRSPIELACSLATIKASGEDITVNEVRSIMGFPEHPDSQVGNSYINGDPVVLDPPSKELLQKVKSLLQYHDSKLLDEEFFAQIYPKFAEALK